MKQYKSFTFALAVLFLLGITLTSCTKEGPKGPAGADGKDGNATCGACHNLSTDLYAKIVQYDASVHATGGYFFENRTTCAPCHTHEGFLERMERDSIATLAEVQDPTPINCRTCHQIHKTYTDADYAFTFDAPARLFWGDNTTSHDIGKGNLCANCHQGRSVSPLPTPGGADVTISSSRWGYHHGPQYNLLIGEGGYRTPGGNYATPPASHKNAVTEGCVTCHMAKAVGNMAGGHTWNMVYEETEHNVAACLTCHPGISDFDLNGAQTEIEELLDSLKTLLTIENIYNPANGLMKPGTYSADKAGAYLNYQFVEADRSKGAHNSKYAKALLENSIDALNK